MKRLILILVLLFAVGTFTDAVAQSRKREHKNQRRGGGGGGKRKIHKFSGNKSSGGLFSRMFSGKRRIPGGWVYKPTRPGKKQNQEQHHLFTRYRTKNKRYKDGVQARLNRERARKRSRGNAVFHKRKY